MTKWGDMIMKAKIDLVKIFLTPPQSFFERVTLFLMLTVTFIFFFSPLRFSEMSPVEAILTASLPAVSISWGWIVLLRSIFQKEKYKKEE
jgi:hypothetical protein